MTRLTIGPLVIVGRKAIVLISDYLLTIEVKAANNAAQRVVRFAVR